LQQQVLGRLVDRLLSKGYLAIGTHERLPEGMALTSLMGGPQIFKKGSAAD
jgi:chemotaxis methyl-accepting protein methylase